MEDKPPNVIAFPKKNINTAALKSLEEIRADSIKNKMEYVDELTDDLLSEMFLKLNMSGIDIDITEVKYLKDVGLVVESVKSLVYITSDKCYWNNEWVWGYRETDAL